MEGLVNKPQFDSKHYVVGHPVRLRKRKGGLIKEKNPNKFEDGDYGLIQSVAPLSISILLVSNKVANIPVEDVASGAIIISVVGDIQ